MTSALWSQTTRIYGYEAEIAAVANSMTAAAVDTAPVQGCLVLGPPGVGKTAVINAALAATVTRTPAYRFRGAAALRATPFGIFDVFLTAPPAEPDPQFDRENTAGVLWRLAKAFGADCPIVIVDNADLVDRQSLCALAQLATAGAIRLVAAACSVGPPVDLLAELWLGGRLDRVDLGGIDASAIATMAQALARDDLAVDPAALYGQTRGNPRMLHDLLARSAADVRGRRLPVDLCDDTLLVLELIACMGAFPYHALADLCGALPIDELVRRDLIRCADAGDLFATVAEPDLARVIADAVLPSRSLELWRRTLEVIDPATLAGRSLFGLVGWGLTLGFEQPAARVAAAADWALSHRDFTAADALIRRSGARGVEPLLIRAAALQGLRDPAATALINELNADARLGGWSDTALVRLADLDLRTADPHQPQRRLTAWTHDRVTDPARLGRLNAARAGFDLRGGRLSDARRLATEVYDDARCRELDRLQAAAVLGQVETLAGNIVLGARYLDHAAAMLPIVDPTGEHSEDVLPHMFIARYAAGAWDAALAAVLSPSTDHRTEHATTGTPTGWEHASAPARALLDVAVGRFDHARDFTVPAGACWATADTCHAALAALRYAARVRGRPGSAPAETARVESAMESDDTAAAGSTPSFWARFEAHRFNLAILARTHRDRGARRQYELGLAARAAGAPTLAAAAWIDAACNGHAAAAHELHDTAIGIDGDFGALAASIAAAELDGQPDALVESARVALDFGAAGLAADLAKNARAGAVEAHNSPAARHALDVLRACMRDIEFGTGTRLPDLTDFEQHLLDGVLADHTSSRLAAGLHLSPRTVEWHLTRLYRRFHVAGRRELKALVTGQRAPLAGYCAPVEDPETP